jgi:hypothetical protein
VRRWAASLLVVALAAVLLASCSFMGGRTEIHGSTSSCTNLPAGACDEQVQAFAQRFPQAQSIDIECRALPCTRAAGAGTVVVTLADGTTRNDTFAYTSNPAPAPVPTCEAIAADMCQRMARSTWEDQRPSAVVVGIDVRCAVASCTEQKGEVEITVTFADGSTSSVNQGWESG